MKNKYFIRNRIYRDIAKSPVANTACQTVTDIVSNMFCVVCTMQPPYCALATAMRFFFSSDLSEILFVLLLLFIVCVVHLRAHMVQWFISFFFFINFKLKTKSNSYRRLLINGSISMRRFDIYSLFSLHTWFSFSQQILVVSRFHDFPNQKQNDFFGFHCSP